MQAVILELHEIAALILNHDPGLLWQENAMGQTPLDLAESLHIRYCTSGYPDIHRKPCTGLQTRDLKTFRNDYHRCAAVVLMWQISNTSAANDPRVRKLISLAEAKKVAKKLTEPAGNGDEKESQVQDGSDDENRDYDERPDRPKKFMDEVDRWGHIYD